jgi:hypothetical protein
LKLSRSIHRQPEAHLQLGSRTLAATLVERPLELDLEVLVEEAPVKSLISP